MNGVWPIIIPQVDWGTLARECVNAFGTSPTEPISRNHDPIDGPDALLKAIATLSDAVEFELRHVHLGFLIDVSKEEMVCLSLNSDLTISARAMLPELRVIAVVSGNLEVWKSAMKRLCKKGKPTGVIMLMNKIYKFMEQGRVASFLDFRKKELGGGLFEVE